MNGVLKTPNLLCSLLQNFLSYKKVPFIPPLFQEKKLVLDFKEDLKL